ncbi:hypothetical protein Sya03_43460 [Spirilliplanes yamanashiensis]|uniref:Uncharacterized protein n=2 Tax=Spirilliplanes yamanashiensis TaxID=42233 RepID=A0A8J4DL88_9ACTN|nr:hypothetical protein Sya03_43460 [Spirilliplanes yamanashiensis]
MTESDRRLIRASQTDDVSRCTLTRLTEAEYANLSARKGVAVYEHRNRYWRNSERFGSLLAVPIHWMMELTPDQVTFPRGHTLAIKARVTEPGENNGSFHLYVIDPAAYGFDSIHKGARKNIRRACRAGVTVELATPELLEREGYEVTAAALKMSGYRKPPTRRDYVRRLHDDTFFGGRGLVLAGMVHTPRGRRLGGIMTGSAIGTVANADDIYTAPWARDTNVGPRLVYSFIEACQRTAGIDTILYGRVSNDEDLEAFKSRMGFPAAVVPAKVVLRPGVRQVVNLFRSTGAFTTFHQRLYGPR